MILTVRYLIDWSKTNQRDRGHSSAIGLEDIARPKGKIELRSDVKTICAADSSVLLDLIQVINSLSEAALQRYRGATLPVSLDEEPACYIVYSDHVAIFEFQPGTLEGAENRALATLSHGEAIGLSTLLRKRILSEIQIERPSIMTFYRSLLF